MIEGVPLVHCWSGDAVSARDVGALSKKLEFVYPLEGFPVWVDNMSIPVGAPSPYAAHLFMDYICDPRVNAALTNWTRYFSPIAEAAPYIDESILSVMPSEKEFARGEVYESVGDRSSAYNDAWSQVKGA